MLFTTPAFIIFLFVVWALYWRLERRAQNILILLSSCLFYAWWDWRFLGLLLGITGIDYTVALCMDKQENPILRKRLLLVSLATNIGVLGFFKYYNFFVDSLHGAFKSVGIHSDSLTLQIILPLGISFYTFQALSYTIDVYRKRMEPVHDIVQYFCFITFFPHLVAGPINFAKDLLVQFERDRHFDADVAADGTRQMLLGFFKKVVIADSLAQFVNTAYGDAAGTSGGWLFWATYAFAFQIYCDFSGYTDIAIGCAKLFDIHLMRNFNYPYFSRSIPEFWKRWHISLTTWFRDYLYIPLGGNRVSKPRQLLNIMIVFLVSGLWHGANWTFVIWGFLHGLFYIGYVSLWPGTNQSARDGGAVSQSRWLIAINTFLTFNLVCFAWVFFRAESYADGIMILRKIGSALLSGDFQRPPIKVTLLIVGLCLVEWLHRNRSHGFDIKHWKRPLRWGLYYGVSILILYSFKLDYVPFIYFQF
jgi:D-alanyl-lipoteichoic acid acyltransferase DltB (MBOAT superfamily)